MNSVKRYGPLVFIIILLGNKAYTAQPPSPEFSHTGGFYQEPFELTLSVSDENAVIYYTLDGSIPDTNSYSFNSSITIENRTDEPNDFSTIRTSYITGPWGWHHPADLVYKAMVVRARVINNDGQKSDIVTHTYFVGDTMESRYSLPVISIVTDRENFFSDSIGIYVPGDHYDGENYHTGNFRQRGEEWERPVHIEYFERDGTLGFGQDAGARIHGGYSRSFPMKSLRMYARSLYGVNRFYYPVFPNQPDADYNRFILRNSGNDFNYTMFRDAAMQRSIEHLKIDTQAYNPVIVFINGEYWGIKNIRERYDRHYLERTHNLDGDNVDILTRNKIVKEGSNDHYTAMMQYIRDHDLSEKQHYEHVKTMMDVENYIDYYAIQIYNANTDWPHNNIDYWRYRTDEYEPDAPYGQDGRWRWKVYDVDRSLGMVSHTHNTIEWATASLNPRLEEEWPNELFRALLQNDEFKFAFINRIADLLNIEFQPGRMINIIDELQDVIAPEMQEHIERWQIPSSYDTWQQRVQAMRNFAENRPAHLKQHVIDHFNLEGTAPVTIDVSDKHKGALSINGVTIDDATVGIDGQPYPFTGVYFKGVPITLIAESYPGYTFAGWKDTDIHSDTLVIEPTDTTQITAVFIREGEFDADPMNPTAYDLSQGPYRFNYWPEDKPEGSLPPHMVFLQTDMTDPGLVDEMTGVYHVPEDEYHEDDEAKIGYPYMLTRRTRLTGWNDGGITFINTGRDRDLGAAVLALNTTGLDSITVSWTSGTLLPNERVYAIRLQYRVGAGGPFKDVLDRDGNPVEYIRNELEEHYQFMEPVVLPEEVDHREYIQLRWKYYHVSGSSGPRAKLLLDNILVTSGVHPHTLYPEPHDLSEGMYEFTHWYSDEPEGSFPPNMVFLQTRMDDPRLDDEMVEPYHIPFYNEEYNAYHADDQGMFGSVYQLTGRTRITGLEADGISFINTGRGRDLGAAVLGLNTTGQRDISVEWKGGTVIPNSRVYHIRLQYRIGRDGPFVDVHDVGVPVQYKRSEIVGHSESFGPVTLPEVAEDQPYIQLRWKYYYTGDRLDDDVGRRDELRIGDIRVSSVATTIDEDKAEIPEKYYLAQNYTNPFNPHTTIRYGLPERSHVRIVIYSVLGRKVATIVDEERDAGSHKVQWAIPPGGLASGVYYYRIEATQVGNPNERFIETNSMVIIK